MSFTATGVIKQIFDTQVVSDKFKKREFIIEVPNGNFSDNIALQFTNDKVDKLNGFTEGMKVNVDFNIQSKEYNGRWFTNNTCWRISASEAVSTTAQQQAQPIDDPSSSLPF